MAVVLEERKDQVLRLENGAKDIVCEKESLAGSVSQRACVFCGSRVVLYPIADALHLIHGPIGCAAYTWDIRGALSSGPELHRISFSTDLTETDVIYGGEKKLYQALSELIDEYKPKAAFVYSTCIIGIIGDDVQSVCKKAAKEKNIPVLPVHSEGFKGIKKDGYKAACDALYRLMDENKDEEYLEDNPFTINIMGDFNLAGETWMIKEYYQKMGIKVITALTGDSRVDEIKKCRHAKLNIVQCSGSMMSLAKKMKEVYGIPYIKVSYFGIEDVSDALYQVALFFNDKTVLEKTQELVRSEIERIYPKILEYRKALEGKKAAVYVGGAFKAFSLIKALKTIGMKTEIVGSQTGNQEDYKLLREVSGEGTIIVDDTNPLELSGFIREKKVQILIGGVKERPIAYKMGIGFCDHNHERKTALAGFQGMLNFAYEVYSTVESPVWKWTQPDYL
ncbi:MAG: nitrogenase iron-molybdenum cofactor biosynthesis protein NifE [Spirochaetes bacterium GWB1_36_13]|nr:MAG: nitrogenase iron-molybdenum cofactor biosynthesis protein NifE [Spirochaetes bacterium GWB1_36_13]